MATIESHSEAETDAVASRVARALRPGTAIALEGQMGAGKTRFARGLVKALGGDPRLVSSPTFVLLNIYPTPTLTVYHLDAYRVAGADDLEAIGFSELLEQGGVVIVEWASKVAEALPKGTVKLSIEVVGENARKFEIDGLSL